IPPSQAQLDYLQALGDTGEKPATMADASVRIQAAWAASHKGRSKAGSSLRDGWTGGGRETPWALGTRASHLAHHPASVRALRARWLDSHQQCRCKRLR